MKLTTHKRNKAITLIEVLISIAVFSVGILSISSLIINNIGLSDRTKLKTTATMLAKEGIELVYNRRDTNIKKGWLWNCLELKQGSYAGECEIFFHKPTDLTNSTKRIIAIDPLNAQGQSKQAYMFVAAAQNTPLLNKKKSNDGTFTILNSYVGGKKIVSKDDNSPFSRTITFSPVFLSPEGGSAHPDKILKVTSTVSYKKGAYSGSVAIQSFIGDTLDTIPLDYFQ